MPLGRAHHPDGVRKPVVVLDDVALLRREHRQQALKGPQTHELAVRDRDPAPAYLEVIPDFHWKIAESLDLVNHDFEIVHVRRRLRTKTPCVILRILAANYKRST